MTNDKVLTDRAVDAVRKLGEAGILFAVTSGRPPKGMSMLIEPLNLSTPIAAFNGGLLVNRDMSVIEQRVLPEDLVQAGVRAVRLVRPRHLGLPGGGLVRARPQGRPRGQGDGHREVRARRS